MYTRKKVVYVVDDDAVIRSMIERMLVAAGYEVRAFGSARGLLECASLDRAQCFILDIFLPDLNGMELQQQLQQQNAVTPIVFITGYGDIPMTVKAMQQGAIDFLAKPFQRQQLLDAVRKAIGKHVQTTQELAEYENIEERRTSLSPREKQVFEMVCLGLMNREIASELGTSEQTVKLQRANVMRKMQVETLADLVRLHERLSEARKRLKTDVDFET